MNEIAKLTEVCRESKCYGLLCILIDPETGEAVQYTRLIEPKILVAGRKHFRVMQLFTDDAGYALLRALPERE